MLQDAQSNPTTASTETLLRGVQAFIWGNANIKQVIGNAAAAGSNDFALGYSGLGPLFEFLRDYAEFMNKPTRINCVEEVARIQQCHRVEDFFTLVITRLDELRLRVRTSADSWEYGIDPSGFSHCLAAITKRLLKLGEVRIFLRFFLYRT